MEKGDRRLAYLKERYASYLRREEAGCFPAKRLGLKGCQRCGYCCIFLTCVPRPDELEPIAAFLGIKVKRLVQKYTVIDKFVNTNYFLRWIKEGQEGIAGGLLAKERMFDLGYCIFFDKENKRCIIYKVRPREAMDWNCWDDSPSDAYSTGASAWARYDICSFVPDFQPARLRILRLNKVVDIKTK